MGRRPKSCRPAAPASGIRLVLRDRSCIPENGQSLDSAVKERFVLLHKVVLENGLSQVVDRAA